MGRWAGRDRERWIRRERVSERERETARKRGTQAGIRTVSDT